MFEFDYKNTEIILLKVMENGFNISHFLLKYKSVTIERFKCGIVHGRQYHRP